MLASNYFLLIGKWDQPRKRLLSEKIWCYTLGRLLLDKMNGSEYYAQEN